MTVAASCASAGDKFGRLARAQADVDQMSPDLRACVHEFGYPIVHQCQELGVSDPRHIRQLVTAIWFGGRSVHERPRKGLSGILSRLDALLVQSGSTLTAEGIVRFLEAQSHRIVSINSTREMIDASVDTIASFNATHRRRLATALQAAAVRPAP